MAYCVVVKSNILLWNELHQQKVFDLGVYDRFWEWQITLLSTQLRRSKARPKGCKGDEMICHKLAEMVPLYCTVTHFLQHCDSLTASAFFPPFSDSPFYAFTRKLYTNVNCLLNINVCYCLSLEMIDVQSWKKVWKFRKGQNYRDCN